MRKISNFLINTSFMPSIHLSKDNYDQKSEPNTKIPKETLPAQKNNYFD